MHLAVKDAAVVAIDSDAPALDSLQALLAEQAARITALEIEVALLNGDKGELSATLFARDDEVADLKRELEHLTRLVGDLLEPRESTPKPHVANIPQKHRETEEARSERKLDEVNRELLDVKIDLAVTRIGCQWQQIIQDKDNVHFADETDADNIIQARAQLERSQRDLEIAQDNLAATCLSANERAVAAACREPEASSTLYVPNSEILATTSPRNTIRVVGFDVAQDDLQALPDSTTPIMTAKLTQQRQKKHPKTSLVTHTTPGTALDTAVSPALTLSKKQISAVELHLSIKQADGELFIPPAASTLIWTAYPQSALLVQPTRRLSRAGWISHDSSYASELQRQAKELLVPLGEGKHRYVGSFVAGGVRNTRVGELPAEALKEIVERTLCSTVKAKEEATADIRARYSAGTLRVSVCELRRTGYSANVAKTLADIAMRKSGT